jgi:hypothetical protein
LLKAYEHICQAMTHPKHLILTVKNTPHLTREMVQAIAKAIKKLFRRVFYKKRVLGGLLALEVTNSRCLN